MVNFQFFNTLLRGTNLWNEVLARSERKNSLIIKRDILRDLLFLGIDPANIKNNNNNKKTEYKKISETIESIDAQGYNSGLDRFIEKAQNLFILESFNHNTKPQTTISFGGYLVKTVNILIEALIIAVLLGDYSGLRKIRTKLAEILYSFFKLDEYNKLLSESIKLFIIENSTTVLRKIINAEWDNLYKFLYFSNMNPFSILNDLKENKHKLIIRCMVIENFGEYFSDKDLVSSKKFVLSCLEGKSNYLSPIDLKLNGLKAIKGIINRTDIYKILPNLFKDNINNFWILEQMYNIFREIRWERVEQKFIKELLVIILKNIEKINLKDRLYIIFNKIKEYEPELLSELDLYIYNDLLKKMGSGELWYFSNHKFETERGELLNICNSILEKIKEINDKLIKNSSIEFGGYSLFHVLSNYIISNDLGEILDNTYDVYTSILLNPYQTLENKIDCIDSINRITDINKPKFTQFGKNIVSIIKQDNRINKFRDSFLKSFKESLELKIDLLNLKFYKPERIESIIAKCIDYGMYASPDVRMESLIYITSLSKIIDKRKNNINEILQFLYLKTFDNWFKIRGLSIQLLSYLSKTNKEWENNSIARMKNLLKDSNLFVRSSIILAIEKTLDTIKGNPDYRLLLEIASDDKHFLIREKSKNLIKSLS